MLSKIKQLGSDTLTYGFANVVGRFLNFLLTPMYSNLLVGKEYEFVIYIYTLFAFVNVVYSIGMESAFFRFYKNNTSDNSRSVFTHSYLIINFISLFFSFWIIILSDPIGYFLSDGQLLSASEIIKLSALIPLFDAMILIPFAYLRMTNQAKKFTIVKFFMIIITVILNYVLLKYFNMQAKGVIISQLITSFLGLLYFSPLIIKNLLLKLDRVLFAKMFKFGLPTIPASLSAIILQVADRPILTELSQSYHSVVTYQVNYRLGIPMMIFVTIFEYAWKPFYLTHYTDKDAKYVFSKILTYFTIISAFIFLLVSLFIEYIVYIPGIGGKYFINPEYWEGMAIIPIVLAGYYFNGIFTNISAGFLIEKKTHILPIAVGVAAIVNIISNFTLIPVIGYFGAAWSTLISYIVSAGILYYYSLKIYPINYEWRKIFLICIFSLIIFLISTIFFSKLTVLFSVFSKFILLALFVFGLIKYNIIELDELNSIKKLIRK